MSEDGFVPVARVGDLQEDGQKAVSVGGSSILLCRSDGQYFAVQNRCTHDMESLTGGTVRKCTIVCPIHGARFSLKTGMPFGPPAFEPLSTYEVRLVGDAIEVRPAPNP